MAKVNETLVSKFAGLIGTMGTIDPGLNFYSYGGIYDGTSFPPLDHPHAINFFFATTLQNHGFWLSRVDGGYARPLTGRVNGKEAKGSDLMAMAAMRAFAQDPSWCDPLRLAVMKRKEFEGVFSDDNGTIPFQDGYARWITTLEFGAWLASKTMTPLSIVEEANKSRRSLDTFLALMREVPGFDEDPLEKKSLLLAMALSTRPEKFLRVNDPERWRPIVDYHLMRVILRLGLVELAPEELESNEARDAVSHESEANIRRVVYIAVLSLMQKTGRTMAEIDFLLWSARRYCPEMTVPNCEKCALNSVCEQRTTLFQPVYRTFFY